LSIEACFEDYLSLFLDGFYDDVLSSIAPVACSRTGSMKS